MDIVEQLRKYQCPENTGCNPVVEYCQCALMDSSADEIERLRWENANMEKLWGKSEGTWMEIRDKQDAEIERLREALKSISKIPNSESAYGIIQVFVDDALKEKE